MTNVDLILSGGIVLSMDSQFSIFEPGAVAVSGSEIVAVGPQADIEANYSATEVLDCAGKVIMPGLINAHTHVPMSLLRALADDLRLDVWLMGYIMPVEREFVHPDFCWLGTQLGCAEMIRSGTTCFVDMYYFEDTIAKATAEAGLRAVCGQTILKFPAPDALSYDESLAQTANFIQAWQDHPLIIPSVAPHAPYTATPKMLQASAALALKFDVPLQIHVAETSTEEKQMWDEVGMRPLPWVEKQNILNTKAIVAHGVYLNQAEIVSLAQHKTGLIHNPTSNLKLASGFAPVTEMLAQGVNVGIGTDGVASNNDLDMFEELRLAALLAKGVTQDPTVVPARQALAMATSMGAKAIHLDHLIGSLEPGKRADIISVDINQSHNWPHFQRDEQSIYSRLVYASKGSDVTDVLCNGVWLMRDKNLLTVDEPNIMKEAQQLAHKIDAFLIEREQSVLRKLAAIGEGLAPKETFEVQAKIYLPQTEAQAISMLLSTPKLSITKSSQRQQFDTYFVFDDKWASRIRYREDEIIALDGLEPILSERVQESIYRLTLTNEETERDYGNSVVLTHAHFDAQADRSLRFYREYFNPDAEYTLHKFRRRFHVMYEGLEFVINLDKVKQLNEDGVYLEIKSTTWSTQDAAYKAKILSQLFQDFSQVEHTPLLGDYLSLVTSGAE